MNWYELLGTQLVTSPFARFNEPAGGSGEANGGQGGGDAGGDAGGDTGGNTDGEGGNNPSSVSTYELQVNGEKRTMTLDELKTAAQKAEAANAKFEEAANLRKEAEAAVKTMNIIKKLNSSETLSYEEAGFLADNIGGEASDYMDTPTQNTQTQQPTRTQEPQDTKPQGPITLDMLDPQLQEQIKGVVTHNMETQANDALETVKKELRESLDKDDVIGKMLSKVPEEKKSDLSNALFDMLFEDISQKVGVRRLQYGPEMIQESLQKVRNRLSLFGNPTSGNDKPVIPVTGMSALSTEATSQIMSDEPIKRVEATSSKYADNFAARLAQALAKNSTK